MTASLVRWAVRGLGLILLLGPGVDVVVVVVALVVAVVDSAVVVTVTRKLSERIQDSE